MVRNEEPSYGRVGVGVGVGGKAPRRVFLSKLYPTREHAKKSSTHSSLGGTLISFASKWL